MSGISCILSKPEISPSLVIGTAQPNPSQNSFSFLDTQIKQFREEIQKDKEDGYIVPKRRLCGTGPVDSRYLVARAASTVFISPQEIIGAPRSMKFLPCPLSELEDMDAEEELYCKTKFPLLYAQAKIDALKREQAVAITKEGKHVVLQQAITSCVASSLAMLILDQGGGTRLRFNFRLSFSDGNR